MLTVLLIGGYGTFGRHITARLAATKNLHLIIAGRTLSKAIALCAEYTDHPITLSPLEFDRVMPVDPQILKRPDVIIDASGPFQNYTDEAIADYCIAQAIPYFDLSDDREFCARIMAKSSQTPLITGLSTYPVLTAAVAKSAASHFSQITKIYAGISPAPATHMGRNVVAAVATKAGETMTALEGGRLTTFPAMTHTRIMQICPPGGENIGKVLFSRADTPETDALPRLFPQLTDIWCGAGPRPTWLHQIFITLAKLRAKKCLPNLGRFAGLMHLVQNALPARDMRGAMRVDIEGLDHDNAALTRRWHLVARGDSGPNIPALPAAILIQHILNGQPLPAGPHYASDLLELEDFNPHFTELGITHGFRGAMPKAHSLYHRILGTAYESLPPSLRALHDIEAGKTFTGMANITRGRNPIANLVANIFGFPRKGEDIPVTVSLTRRGNIEHWERHFGGKRMFSTQEAGRGQDEFQILERFGPVAVRLQVTLTDQRRLVLTPTAFRVFGVPLPKFMFPRGLTYEHQMDGRFNFHVDIIAPIIGRLVKYKGHLTQTKTPPKGGA